MTGTLICAIVSLLVFALLGAYKSGRSVFDK